MAITHRERVVSALNHEETDRVPIDFGGSHETGIQADAYAGLLKHYGFEPEEVVGRDGGTEATIVPSEKVLKHLDVDVRGLDASIRAVDARTQVDENTLVDGWGVTWRRADAASPYMNTHGPLQHLDEPTIADAESLPWADGTNPVNVAGLRDRFEKLRNETDYALVLKLRNVGILYLGQRIRGFSEFLTDLVLQQDFANAFQEIGTNMVCDFARTVLTEVGDLVDGVSIADDLGIQTSPMMNPDLYRKMVKPYHKRLGETIHENTDAKVILHSCGAIRPLLGDLIDCGINVLNPVQVNAAGMDPGELKRDFGEELSFWGGIDTQIIMPTGSPTDVANEVRARIGDLGRGGGYVLAAVHNIRADVPPENVAAMYETALETPSS
jgi:uroporphyrinogen decarboxylase